MPTIFERIISRELPADILFENDNLIVFNDIAPKAPIHILIVTKKVIPNLQSMETQDLPLLAEIVQVAQQLAKQLGVENGYRLVNNCGSDAGQVVFHLHFHFLAGGHLGGMS